MHFVYILLDQENRVYIGCTKDLDRRLLEHLSGKCRTTRLMEHPKLYYYEAYTDEAMALDREKKLKIFGSAYTGLAKRIGLKNL